MTRGLLKVCVFMNFLLMLSCNNEERIISDESATVLTLSISSNSRSVSSLPETTINKLRVIVFRSNSAGVEFGSPIVNKVIPGGDPTRISEAIPHGYFSLYLVANEVSADVTLLNSIASTSDIDNVIWNYANNKTPGDNYLSEPFIMSSVYKNLHIDKAGVITGSGIKGSLGNYQVNIERNVAKVTLTISGDDVNLGGPMTPLSATIVKLPSISYFTPKEYAGTTHFRLPSLTLIEGVHWARNVADDGFEAINDAMVFYVPEYLVGEANKTNYSYISIAVEAANSAEYLYKLPLGDGVGASGYTNPEAIDANIATIDPAVFSLTRNTHYRVNAIIKKLGAVNGVFIENVVAPWVDADIDGSVVAPYLNISNVLVDIEKGATRRIFFWTNQLKASIKDNGLKDGVTPFVVADVFDGITGGMLSNFSFDSVSGQGYIDLVNNKLETGSKYTIALKSGNLSKQIIVNGLQ